MARPTWNCFFNRMQIIEEHKSQRHPRVEERKQKSPKATVRLAKVPVEPNPRNLYPHLLVCSPVLSLLDPSLFSSPSPSSSMSHHHLPEGISPGARSPRRLFWSCCSVTITTFSLLDRPQLARPSPPVAL